MISEIANKCEFKAMSAYKNRNVPAAMSILTDVKDKHVMFRKGKQQNFSRPVWFFKFNWREVDTKL
jgi:hypothetical protein